LNGEIISSDSVQQYIGLDIGSNKVSHAARKGIIHHCLDTSGIGNRQSVADWSNAAHNAIRSIHSRNKIPIVVGGSGFYLRWLVHPLQRSDKQPLNEEHVQAIIRAFIEDERGTEEKAKSFKEDYALQVWTNKMEEKMQQIVKRFGGTSNCNVDQATIVENKEKLIEGMEYLLTNGGKENLRATIDEILGQMNTHTCFLNINCVDSSLKSHFLY